MEKTKTKCSVCSCEKNYKLHVKEVRCRCGNLVEKKICNAKKCLSQPMVFCSVKCKNASFKEKYASPMEKNPSWKGDNVGYASLHEWIMYHKPKPVFCECCGKLPPNDLANISGEYKRDVSDFEWLCRRCHMTKDGRLEQLKIRLIRR